MSATDSILKKTLARWHKTKVAKRPKPPKIKECVVTLKEANKYKWPDAVWAAKLYKCLILGKGSIRDATVALWTLYRIAEEGDWKRLAFLKEAGGAYARMWTVIRSNKQSSLRTNAYNAMRFARWCDARELKHMLQVEEWTIQCFLADSVSRGVKAATCANLRAGISFLFRVNRSELALSTWTHDTMKVIVREFAIPPTQRPPISRDFILAASELLKSGAIPTTIQYVLGLLAMTLAYLCNCRGEHLTKAVWSRLFITKFGDNALIRIIHTDSKVTDGSETNHSSCIDSPATLGWSIVRFLGCVAKHQQFDSKYIFAWKQGGNWHRFDSTKQAYYYNRYAKLLGRTQLISYGAHSPRIGSATFASTLGVSEEKRRVHGKWTKNSAMQTRYDLTRTTVGAELTALLLQTDEKTSRDLDSTIKLVRNKIAAGMGPSEPWTTIGSSLPQTRLAAARKSCSHQFN